MSIKTAANHAINKEKKGLGVISARIKKLGSGNERVSKGSVTEAEVSGGPASDYSNAHRLSSDGHRLADTIAQPGYPAIMTSQYTPNEGSLRTAAQYNVLTACS